jgi:hypothetical protein
MAGPAACPAQSRLTPFRHSVVQIGALKRWEASARSPYEAFEQHARDCGEYREYRQSFRVVAPAIRHARRRRILGRHLPGW